MLFSKDHIFEKHKLLYIESHDNVGGGIYIKFLELKEKVNIFL